MICWCIKSTFVGLLGVLITKDSIYFVFGPRAFHKCMFNTLNYVVVTKETIWTLQKTPFKEISYCVDYTMHKFKVKNWFFLCARIVCMSEGFIKYVIFINPGFAAPFDQRPGFLSLFTDKNVIEILSFSFLYHASILCS